MADALCGPSNALQTFQKHTQTDRTLQQDRLRGAKHSPGQGFRSHDPRAGSLDAEFHAFENGNHNLFQLEQPAFHNHGPVTTPGPGVSNWATDFQRLQISNQPIPAHQFRAEAPLVRSAAGGWHQEFMRQPQNMTQVSQRNHAEISSNSSSSYVHPAEQYAPSPSYPLSSMAFPQQLMQMDLQQNTSLHQNQALDAGFEQEFEDAFAQIDAMHEQQSHDLSFQDMAGISSGVEEMTTTLERPSIVESEDLHMQDVTGPKIGSDAIEYTEVKDRTIDQDTRDAGELARVAGQLIQNISHETDEKFQNSQFLDLMRKIRDREIEVRNNDFESTQTKDPVVDEPKTNQNMFDPLQIRISGCNFTFPNMNSVYQPDQAIDTAQDYSFDSDQYPSAPRTQISDLHPGGPHYPEQSPPHPRYAQMSGAVNEGVSAGGVGTQQEKSLSSDQYTTA